MPYRAIAKHGFTGEGPTELTFPKGALLHVFAQDGSGWAQGSCEGKIGWFPASYIRKVETQQLQQTQQQPIVLPQTPPRSQQVQQQFQQKSVSSPSLAGNLVAAGAGRDINRPAAVSVSSASLSSSASSSQPLPSRTTTRVAVPARVIAVQLDSVASGIGSLNKTNSSAKMKINSDVNDARAVVAPAPPLVRRNPPQSLSFSAVSHKNRPALLPKSASASAINRAPPAVPPVRASPPPARLVRQQQQPSPSQSLRPNLKVSAPPAPPPVRAPGSFSFANAALASSSDRTAPQPKAVSSTRQSKPTKLVHPPGNREDGQVAFESDGRALEQGESRILSRVSPFLADSVNVDASGGALTDVSQERSQLEGAPSELHLNDGIVEKQPTAVLLEEKVSAARDPPVKSLGGWDSALPVRIVNDGPVRALSRHGTRKVAASNVDADERSAQDDSLDVGLAGLSAPILLGVNAAPATQTAVDNDGYFEIPSLADVAEEATNIADEEHSEHIENPNLVSGSTRFVAAFSRLDTGKTNYQALPGLPDDHGSGVNLMDELVGNRASQRGLVLRKVLGPSASAALIDHNEMPRTDALNAPPSSLGVFAGPVATVGGVFKEFRWQFQLLLQKKRVVLEGIPFSSVIPKQSAIHAAEWHKASTLTAQEAERSLHILRTFFVLHASQNLRDVTECLMDTVEQFLPVDDSGQDLDADGRAGISKKRALQNANDSDLALTTALDEALLTEDTIVFFVLDMILDVIRENIPLLSSARGGETFTRLNEWCFRWLLASGPTSSVSSLAVRHCSARSVGALSCVALSSVLKLFIQRLVACKSEDSWREYAGVQYAVQFLNLSLAKEELVEPTLQFFNHIVSALPRMHGTQLKRVICVSMASAIRLCVAGVGSPQVERIPSVFWEMCDGLWACARKWSRDKKLRVPCYRLLSTIACYTTRAGMMEKGQEVLSLLLSGLHDSPKSRLGFLECVLQYVETFQYDFLQDDDVLRDYFLRVVVAQLVVAILPSQRKQPFGGQECLLAEKIIFSLGSIRIETFLHDHVATVMRGMNGNPGSSTHEKNADHPAYQRAIVLRALASLAASDDAHRSLRTGGDAETFRQIYGLVRPVLMSYNGEPNVLQAVIGCFPFLCEPRELSTLAIRITSFITDRTGAKREKFTTQRDSNDTSMVDSSADKAGVVTRATDALTQFIVLSPDKHMLVVVTTILDKLEIGVAMPPGSLIEILTHVCRIVDFYVTHMHSQHTTCGLPSADRTSLRQRIESLALIWLLYPETGVWTKTLVLLSLFDSPVFRTTMERTKRDSESGPTDRSIDRTRHAPFLSDVLRLADAEGSRHTSQASLRPEKETGRADSSRAARLAARAFCSDTDAALRAGSTVSMLSFSDDAPAVTSAKWFPGLDRLFEQYALEYCTIISLAWERVYGCWVDMDQGGHLANVAHRSVSAKDLRAVRAAAAAGSGVQDDQNMLYRPDGSSPQVMYLWPQLTFFLAKNVHVFDEYLRSVYQAETRGELVGNSTVEDGSNTEDEMRTTTRASHGTTELGKLSVSAKGFFDCAMLFLFRGLEYDATAETIAKAGAMLAVITLEPALRALCDARDQTWSLIKRKGGRSGTSREELMARTRVVEFLANASGSVKLTSALYDSSKFLRAVLRELTMFWLFNPPHFMALPLTSQNAGLAVVAHYIALEGATSFPNPDRSLRVDDPKMVQLVIDFVTKLTRGLSADVTNTGTDLPRDSLRREQLVVGVVTSVLSVRSGAIALDLLRQLLEFLTFCVDPDLRASTRQGIAKRRRHLQEPVQVAFVAFLSRYRDAYADVFFRRCLRFEQHRALFYFRALVACISAEPEDWRRVLSLDKQLLMSLFYQCSSLPAHRNEALALANTLATSGILDPGYLLPEHAAAGNTSMVITQHTHYLHVQMTRQYSHSLASKYSHVTPGFLNSLAFLVSSMQPTTNESHQVYVQQLLRFAAPWVANLARLRGSAMGDAARSSPDSDASDTSPPPNWDDTDVGIVASVLRPVLAITTCCNVPQLHPDIEPLWATALRDGRGNDEFSGLGGLVSRVVEFVLDSFVVPPTHALNRLTESFSLKGEFLGTQRNSRKDMASLQELALRSSDSDEFDSYSTLQNDERYTPEESLSSAGSPATVDMRRACLLAFEMMCRTQDQKLCLDYLSSRLRVYPGSPRAMADFLDVSLAMLDERIASIELALQDQLSSAARSSARIAALNELKRTRVPAHYLEQHGPGLTANSAISISRTQALHTVVRTLASDAVSSVHEASAFRFCITAAHEFGLAFIPHLPHLLQNALVLFGPHARARQISFSSHSQTPPLPDGISLVQNLVMLLGIRHGGSEPIRRSAQSLLERLRHQLSAATVADSGASAWLPDRDVLSLVEIFSHHLPSLRRDWAALAWEWVLAMPDDEMSFAMDFAEAFPDDELPSAASKRTTADAAVIPPYCKGSLRLFAVLVDWTSLDFIFDVVRAVLRSLVAGEQEKSSKVLVVMLDGLSRAKASGLPLPPAIRRLVVHVACILLETSNVSQQEVAFSLLQVCEPTFKELSTVLKNAADVIRTLFKGLTDTRTASGALWFIHHYVAGDPNGEGVDSLMMLELIGIVILLFVNDVRGQEAAERWRSRHCDPALDNDAAVFGRHFKPLLIPSNVGLSESAGDRSSVAPTMGVSWTTKPQGALEAFSAGFRAFFFRRSHFLFLFDVLILLIRRGVATWRYATILTLRNMLANYDFPCSAAQAEALAELVVYYCHSLRSTRVAEAAETLLPEVNKRLRQGVVPLSLFNLLRPAPGEIYDEEEGKTPYFRSDSSMRAQLRLNNVVALCTRICSIPASSELIATGLFRFFHQASLTVALQSAAVGSLNGSNQTVTDEPQTTSDSGGNDLSVASADDDSDDPSVSGRLLELGVKLGDAGSDGTSIGRALTAAVVKRASVLLEDSFRPEKYAEEESGDPALAAAAPPTEVQLDTTESN